MKVGDVMPFSQRVVTEFFGRTRDMPAFESRSSHPDCKTVGMMIATGGAAAAKFQPRCATELRREHHDDIIHQSALFQILNQTGNGQIHASAQPGVIVLELLVRVPGTIRGRKNLYEPHAALDQTPGGEQLLTGDLRRVVVESVQF